jgi:hypothetical protein
MAEFLIQYRIDNQLKSVTLTAPDARHAGRVFGEKFSNVPLEDVIDVHTLSGPGDSFIIFVKTLWGGNFGLPMTYWGYGVLGGIVWAIAILSLSPEPGSALDRAARFLMIAYFAIVYVGIWRASNTYSGNRAWAILAKFVVIVVVLPITIGLLKLLVSSA